jgi:hypothetical protein
MRLIERPGFIGRQKKEKYDQWDKIFGKGNWGFVWKWGELLIPFEQACLIYEDAYYQDSLDREGLWRYLFDIAKDFIDNAETNVNSGTDYSIQEAYSTHIQDISVRRVGIRRGWKMAGEELVQIRGQDTKGYELMPGKVKFHQPKMIESPNISPTWAELNSVESFYQNNRWLYLKE